MKLEVELVMVAGLSGRRHIDLARGERVFLKIEVRTRAATVVIYPREDPVGDTWNLGSAYFEK